MKPPDGNAARAACVDKQRRSKKFPAADPNEASPQNNPARAANAGKQQRFPLSPQIAATPAAPAAVRP
ncbi:hypothetical protein [Agrilutibacter solisilvae]|uniref:Uncharacterized protein n=1 Tax=Agrilutibacter solisilvae TaxID=2763317 RepID=A0A974Y1C1_9GAMM|nr:hypothetical protein [Lysobacter solisilvae]QSX79626.1 hypothetical protein I8J32_007225 [Lysobacter solisilvae]